MIAVRANMIVVADALVTANVAIDTVVAEQRGLRGRYRRGKYVTKKMHISKKWEGMLAPYSLQNN